MRTAPRSLTSIPSQASRVEIEDDSARMSSARGMGSTTIMVSAANVSNHRVIERLSRDFALLVFSFHAARSLVLFDAMRACLSRSNEL